MKLLLDSADITEIKNWVQSDVIAGVTTNPSLVAKETKRDYLEMLQEIAKIVNDSVRDIGKQTATRKHLSVEVTTLNPDKMIEQAIQLDKFLQRFSKVDVFIKIPIMPETLRVISTLRHEHHVRINATAAMTSLQAKMASDAGAHVVSFFYNRILDYKMQQEKERNGIKKQHPNDVISEYKVRLGGNLVPCIIGSIRTVDDVAECWDQNADFVTVGPKVLRQMMMHPKTTEAIEQFQKDFDDWQK